MKVIGVIPSRLGSTRLPGKALVDICGMSLIAHVCHRAKMAKRLDDLYVATDSEEIKAEVERYGFKCLMTSSEHRNGTERLIEAINYIDADADIIVSIFGDEALLNPEDVDTSVETLLSHDDADASILMIDYAKKNSPSDFKAVANLRGELMYMSRNDIPSDARNKCDRMLKLYHILSFRRQTLIDYSKMDKTPLEKIEDHEHLRLLEHGYKIQTAKVNTVCLSVDTYDDLDYVRNKMNNDVLYANYKFGRMPEDD